MPDIKLEGCTATPFGSYLKALGVLRLVSEQTDPSAQGWWEGTTFTLRSKLSGEELVQFFIEQYAPTPIVAPWNGGSGFYVNDNHDAIDSIAGSTGDRFAAYRETIRICRDFPEVASGKSKDEDERRSAILRRCRNQLNDRAVDWLDAAVGISADGSRSFAPVLGTGGNEGRLDYTNNFMARVAGLLIGPQKKEVVQELLANALLGYRTTALQQAAAGQYDPGRAGGANQGPGIEHSTPTNPWDLVLTLEGAAAWASGLYRRQGVGYRAVLCSPFTVYSKTIGYGSAAKKDDARAEVWTPLWPRPVRYAELKLLLREGRASVYGRPAKNTLEFAEAATSLGVDRGIESFIRYSFLKRRGDSYVALPTGRFTTGYRSISDRIRKFQGYLDELRDLSPGAEDFRRQVEAAVFQALLTGRSDSMLAVMAALGRLLRRIAITTDARLRTRALEAGPWLEACGFRSDPNVRIAAAVASIYDRAVGPLTENITRAGRGFAWAGSSLCDRMTAVLQRRLQTANAVEARKNPLAGACSIDPGDATLFIEESVDDTLIEELIFAFQTLDWEGFEAPRQSSAELLPVYAVLKCLFLPQELKRGETSKLLQGDLRILSRLKAASIQDAAKMAVDRLRIAGFRPLGVTYTGGVDARRLAAALLIPVWRGKLLGSEVFHDVEESNA